VRSPSGRCRAEGARAVTEVQGSPLMKRSPLEEKNNSYASEYAGMV